MFNIEDKYDDLNHIVDDKYQGPPIGTDANDALWEIAVETEKLGDEIRTMAQMLRRMHSDLSGVENAAQEGRLAEHFRHVPCIADLDENAREVLYGIFTDLVGDIQYQLRQLTRYDRVDEDSAAP